MASKSRLSHAPPLSRSATSRQPLNRAPLSRSQSSLSTYQRHAASSTTSPVTSENASSNRLSPNTLAGLKRKEREYESDHLEETNINVVVRCRGRNERELRENSGVVISTDAVKGTSIELSMGANVASNKTYTFDKVFSPAADQLMVYSEVVAPILDEMLQGFNCTIFAYGQTGTGKTYTMSGDMSDTLGLLSDSAGIIPRVLRQLFLKLENETDETSVKCSFIELYNEELRDLISKEENAKLKIFDDSNGRKSHFGTTVQGMEETFIKSAEEGLSLLQMGSHRRQVASTKCNDLSSRSHTVFTITVYSKRVVDGMEDFVSTGKLNLVDLAGSENIQRSGAENKRAAEAGLINKSLLTLGRVINALVDRQQHIPYRESKLTRLLQDSLGGRTKTCIIATVSPAKSNVEETISTLDYAFRAKNIRNKPQINQMLSKKTLLREFTVEIEKLKSDLIATRQRNGMYLSTESYEELTAQSESRRILCEEQSQKIETMEANLRNKIQELFTLTNNFSTVKKDNEAIKQKLEGTTEVLQKTELVLIDTRRNLEEETTLRQAHESTEAELARRGGLLLSTIDAMTEDINGVREKVRRKSDLQSQNRSTWDQTVSNVQRVNTNALDHLDVLVAQQDIWFGEQVAALSDISQQHSASVTLQQKDIDHIFSKSEERQRSLVSQASNDFESLKNLMTEIGDVQKDVKEKVSEGLQGLTAAAERISVGISNELTAFHSQLHDSMSALGKEFKRAFDDAQQQLVKQKSEAEDLRSQLQSALSAHAAAQDKIRELEDKNIEEDELLAEQERKQMMREIEALVESHSKSRKTRQMQHRQERKLQHEESVGDLTKIGKELDERIVQWQSQEEAISAKLNDAKTATKARIKQDWTAATERNAAIQTTTMAVHGQTIAIVEDQMANLSGQMQALARFVLKGEALGQEIHDNLIKEATNSRTTIDAAVTKTRDRCIAQGSTFEEQMKALANTIPAVVSSSHAEESKIRDSLTESRAVLETATLADYIPTGQTPPRRTYDYPTSLPRTRPSSAETTTTHLTSTTSLLGETSDLLGSSPSKTVVYTDAPVMSRAVFVETSRDPIKGLKEISANVKAGELAASTALEMESLTVPFTKSMGLPVKVKAPSKSIGPEPRAKKPRITVANISDGRENTVPIAGPRKTRSRD